jgi:acyl-CoA thioesterase I
MRWAAVALVASVSALAACSDRQGSEVAAAGAAASPRAAAPEAPAAPAPAPSKARIVCLGDSLTAGYGLPLAAAYPARLAEHLRAAGLDYEVINAGVSGDTSAGGLRRLDWSLAGDVEVLIVALGANDGLRGLPVSELRANLARIVETAQRRQIRVILAGMEAPPNFGAAYTREFRAVYRDLAREYGAAFVPFFLDGVAGVPALNQADGIHPTAEGQRRVAATIWQTLAPLVGARAAS